MPKGRFAKSLIGNTYGLLTVISRDKNNEKNESMWKCKCVCGAEKVISSVKLKNGAYKSCGCMMGKNIHTGNGATFMNELGNRYGKLVIINREKNSKTGNIMWLCRCDCGNVVSVMGSNLRSGDIKSCGCLHRLPNKEDAAFNNLCYIYKKQAKQRNIVWNLSKEDMKILTKQNCFYCGNPPSFKVKASHSISTYLYNGIDRVDNSRGYELNNVVTCCKHCNQAKMALNIDSFKSLIVSIYKNWASK